MTSFFSGIFLCGLCVLFFDAFALSAGTSVFALAGKTVGAIGRLQIRRARAESYPKPPGKTYLKRYVRTYLNRLGKRCLNRLDERYLKCQGKR
jgi:hypothetical protein